VRILAVVYSFPPVLVPAALCYLKLILGLRESGVEVEILEVDPRSLLAPDAGLLDPAVNEKVPADLVRYPVWSLERHPLARAGKRFLGTTAIGMRFFKPRKREWVGPALRRLRRMDLGRYDAVLTCSQPHVNHLIGLRVKATARLPWIAYFGAGRPLLAVTPPRGASARVVREVGGIVCDIADEAGIEAALERLLDEGPPPPPAPAATRPYHYREVGTRLATLLKELKA